jgi:hypothetical protein
MQVQFTRCKVRKFPCIVKYLQLFPIRIKSFAIVLFTLLHRSLEEMVALLKVGRRVRLTLKHVKSRTRLCFGLRRMGAALNTHP